MDPMNKPEWFQIAEKDGGLPRRTAKRGFRAVALSVPLLAIGIGVVVAQSSNESPASAETATVAIASAAPSVAQSVKPSITSTVAPAKPSIATPPLAPTGGDDDEYENEGDDD
jgi:hypothetical protein